MIHAHSLGRGARYYSERAALAEDGNSLSFAELEGRVARIAAKLKEREFKAGDRLALLLPNSPEYIELIYACSWLGVIAVPINVRLSATEIDRVLVDAAPRGIIRDSSLATPTARLPFEKVLDQDPLELGDGILPDAEAVYDPDAVLALIYTSGTTGRAKGVMVTHANILANIHHFNYWMRYTEKGAVYLHAAPLFHIADFPAMFAAPAFGAGQVTISKFSPENFCGTVERECVSHTVLVPTMINLLTQFGDIKKYDLTSLAVLGYGGSPIAPDLMRRAKEVLPNVSLVQVYGLSETGFLTGLQNSEHTASHVLSCGRPCPGIDLAVADESGNTVEHGQHGELVARGANIMRGYWQNAEETGLAFRNGWFRTGDVGYQDAEGFFYILDRLKDMIVTGGENVYSGEVEGVLYTHPAVREAAVFGIPDHKWGELVMACVVLKTNRSVTSDELIAFCRQRLATYKIPRRVEFEAADLPKSGSGKILKRVLRERYWAHETREVS